MTLNSNRKTIAILSVFAKKKHPTLSELVSITELQKSTIMRHLKMLQQDFMFDYEHDKSLRAKGAYRVNCWGVFNPRFIRMLEIGDLEEKDIDVKKLLAKTE